MDNNGVSSYDAFEDAETVIRDQALMIEGLGQANTDLQRQVDQYLNDIEHLGKASARMANDLAKLSKDIRLLREVPIGQLDDAIAELVSVTNELAGR
jgi:predicted RNase H-like nuclease (RuvC/YqgF family)